MLDYKKMSIFDIVAYNYNKSSYNNQFSTVSFISENNITSQPAGSEDAFQLEHFSHRSKYIKDSNYLWDIVKNATSGAADIIETERVLIDFFDNRRMVNYVLPLASIASSRVSEIYPKGFKALGRRLAYKSKNIELVKMGIYILTIAGDNSDIDNIVMLATNDEFTFFSLLVVSRRLTNPEDAVFSIAQNTYGWGRVHALRMLKNTHNSAVKDWMFEYGHYNVASLGECAYICAIACDIAKRVSADELSDSHFIAMGDIISSLICDTVAGGMDLYTKSAELVTGYIKHAKKRVVSKKDILVLKNIYCYLTHDRSCDCLAHMDENDNFATDGKEAERTAPLNKWIKNGWNQEKRAIAIFQLEFLLQK